MKMQSAPPTRAASSRDSGSSRPASTSGELVPWENANIRVDCDAGSMMRRIRIAFPVDIAPPILSDRHFEISNASGKVQLARSLPYRYGEIAVKSVDKPNDERAIWPTSS